MAVGSGERDFGGDGIGSAKLEIGADGLTQPEREVFEEYDYPPDIELHELAGSIAHLIFMNSLNEERGEEVIPAKVVEEYSALEGVLRTVYIRRRYSTKKSYIFEDNWPGVVTIRGK